MSALESVAGTNSSIRRLLRKLRFGMRRLLLLVPHWFIRSFSRPIAGKVAMMAHNSLYACNLKYIYEELKRRDPGRDIIWVVANRACAPDYPKDAKIVFLGTLRCLREVYTSSIWMDNGIAFSNDFERRPDQMHIQTMHGSLGIKNIVNGYKHRKENGRAGRRSARRESELTDYVIVNSSFEEGVFRSVYWKNTPMVRLGHARTDPLFGRGGRDRASIRTDLQARYGVNEKARIALFAPTYRPYLAPSDIDFGFERMIDSLTGKFGGDWCLLVRLHRSTKGIRAARTGGRAVDVTDYPDMQELMMVADVGITDYSSWIFDYVVTGRPGFIFAPDIERYKVSSGLCYPLEDAPFPVAYSVEKLFENVERFDAGDYSRKVKAFLDRMQCVDDGYSAERVANWLESLPRKGAGT